MIAIVELANGFKFPGSACRDQGEAVESAASVAVFQLVRTSLLLPAVYQLSFEINTKKRICEDPACVSKYCL